MTEWEADIDILLANVPTPSLLPFIVVFTLLVIFIVSSLLYFQSIPPPRDPNNAARLRRLQIRRRVLARFPGLNAGLRNIELAPAAQPLRTPPQHAAGPRLLWGDGGSTTGIQVHQFGRLRSLSNPNIDSSASVSQHDAVPGSLRDITSQNSNAQHPFARDNSRPAQLDSPALSDSTEDFWVRLLDYADSGTSEDATTQRMPLSANSSSVDSASYRERTPAEPGFVFAVPVPSTSLPTSRLVPVGHLRCLSESRAILHNAYEDPVLEALQSSSGVHGLFMRPSGEAIQPSGASSALPNRLAHLAHGRPDTHDVGSVTLREEVIGALFSSHRRLVTV